MFSWTRKTKAPIVPEQSATLDAATVVGPESLQKLEIAAQTAAEDIKPDQGPDIHVQTLMGMVGDLYQQYRTYGLGVLEQLAAEFNRLRASYERPIEELDADQMESLRARAKSILVRKAARSIDVSGRMKRLATEIRTLTIGITGSPDRKVTAPGFMKEWGVPMIVLTGAMILEFMLNFGVVRFASDKMTSTGFSLAVSFVALFCAFLAGKCVRTYTTRKNALAEFDRYYGHWDIDRETRESVKVLPLDAGLRMTSIISHSLFIAVVLGMIVFRLYIISTQADDNLGSLAGTFAFAIAVVALYLYKLSGSEVEHPRRRELLNMQDELASMQEEQVLLRDGDDEFTHELDELVAEHHKDAESGAIEPRATIEEVTASQQEFQARYAEFSGANDWFLNLGRRVTGVFFGWAGTRPGVHENKAYQPSLEEQHAMVKGHLSLSLLPDYSNVLDYKPQVEDIMARGTISSAAFVNELWAAAEREAQTAEDQRTAQVEPRSPSYRPILTLAATRGVAG